MSVRPSVRAHIIFRYSYLLNQVRVGRQIGWLKATSPQQELEVRAAERPKLLVYTN
jgi:hypothetical protein